MKKMFGISLRMIQETDGSGGLAISANKTFPFEHQRLDDSLDHFNA